MDTPHTAKGKIKSKVLAKDKVNGKDHAQEEKTLIKILKAPSERKESGANQDYSDDYVDVEYDIEDNKANKTSKEIKAIKAEGSKTNKGNKDDKVKKDSKDKKGSDGWKDLGLSRG